MDFRYLKTLIRQKMMIAAAPMVVTLVLEVNLKIFVPFSGCHNKKDDNSRNVNYNFFGLNTLDFLIDGLAG